ncbi:hypothetical protein B0H16DRAFT_1815991 [Mycena metata]|uniref:Uncharacterized protein n=1 Tax=Mycena metata TaxID=1033252 RepID=A0AAD7H4E1_9AGAR|nr:hypothetical protein B0H16DRAFT_1815991 [Mycena metata]
MAMRSTPHRPRPTTASTRRVCLHARVTGRHNATTCNAAAAGPHRLHCAPPARTPLIHAARRPFHSPSPPLPLHLLPLPVASPTLRYYATLNRYPPTSTSRLSPTRAYLPKGTQRLSACPPSHGGLATSSLLVFLPSHLALPLPRFDALAFATPSTTYAPTLSRRDPFA